MLNVIIYGINPISLIVHRLIDSDKARIINYCTEKEGFLGRTINGVNIINHNEICKLNYDLIVYTEESIELDESGIDIYNFIIKYYDYQLYKVLNKIDMLEVGAQGVCTGLSHIQVGINEEEFRCNFINLAVSSQDIFYDYELIKYILKSKHKETLRIVLIGLTYYSFEYDLSKSINKNRVYYYYQFCKNIHNKKDESNLCNEIDDFDEKIRKIFKENYRLEIFKGLKYLNDNEWENMITSKLENYNIKMGEVYSSYDSKKDYPRTRDENKRILIELIRLLKVNNIEPIIIIMPQTKYYTQLLSSELKSRFEDILNDVQSKECIKVLNYFYSEEFIDEDYYDVAHLNKCGSKKLTNIIRSDIKKCTGILI